MIMQSKEYYLVKILLNFNSKLTVAQVSKIIKIIRGI